jgi:hypothetical protein
MLHSLKDHAECRVHDSPYGIVLHSGSEVERGVAEVPVEPVSVVVVRVPRTGMGDGVRRWVNRVVVERA